MAKVTLEYSKDELKDDINENDVLKSLNVNF